MPIKIPGRKILLTPGPITTTDSVKRAMIVPDICPREEEFGDILKKISKDLIRIVHGGKGYVSVLFCGSGTAVMDACINSVVPPAKKIVVINNGAYGERMVKIAKAHRIPCVEIPFKWDKPLDLEKIKKTLKQNPDIACLAVVHHETTTGMLNPIKAIGDIAEKSKCVFLVDAVSSFAGVPIDVKECKIDFMFSVSNKCIQGMPGIAFVICKKERLQAIKDYPPRSFYLNLFQQHDYFTATNQMQFTPPVQVIYALRQAIREYFKEKGKKRYNRYTTNWQVLREGLEKMGFKFLLKKEEESHILTTVFEPKDPKYDFKKLHDLLYKQGFTIYPGKLHKQDTFRLANIGDIRVKDISRFLKALGCVLTKMGISMPVRY